VRIIAGSAKGRTLLAPRDSAGVRPTADRVRETIFNVLGQWMEGLAVLDLYTGTGALALEAMSRGAASAVLVDLDTTIAGRNARELGFEVTLMRQPVARAIEQLGKRGQKFDLVFSDPPYADEVGAEILAAVRPLLNPGARVVIEHSKREAMPEEGRVDERRFGDTIVSIYE
jgi:16S rRNA (guanine(966)-N(2))-methyltransferase RsmD